MIGKDLWNFIIDEEKNPLIKDVMNDLHQDILSETIKNYLQDILETKETVYFIGAKAFWLDPRLKHFLPRFERERKRLGIKFKHLFDHDVKEKKSEILELVGKPYKFLPAKYSSSTAIDVFGDYVITFVGVKVGELYEEPLQFVLKSRRLADGYRKFFDFIWDHCEEEWVNEMKTKKIILIGPGSIGKTTIGKKLAERLNLKCYDFDSIVEEKLGNLDEYLSQFGADKYREEEHEILVEFLKSMSNKFVMSVGGGTVASQLKDVSSKNVDLLKTIGKLIYLCGSENDSRAIDILRQREESRGGNQSEEETLKLYKLRTPIYENIFDVKIIIETKKPDEIVEEIITEIN